MAADMATLAQDLESVGLTPSDLRRSSEESLNEPRALSRAASARIMSKKFIQRDKQKKKLVQSRELYHIKHVRERQRQVAKCQQRMANSPFMVDLVADNERLDEENRIQDSEEKMRSKTIQTQHMKSKTEIILKALQESSELDALRREKRAILEEERRLKARLDIERTSSHRKSDLLVAQRAERQRKEYQTQKMRGQHHKVMMQAQEMEEQLLKQKLQVQPHPNNTFTSYDIAGQLLA